MMSRNIVKQQNDPFTRPTRRPAAASIATAAATGASTVGASPAAREACIRGRGSAGRRRTLWSADWLPVG
jgi:hypothetical protein